MGYTHTFIISLFYSGSLENEGGQRKIAFQVTLALVLNLKFHFRRGEGEALQFFRVYFVMEIKRNIDNQRYMTQASLNVQRSNCPVA